MSCSQRRHSDQPVPTVPRESILRHFKLQITSRVCSHSLNPRIRIRSNSNINSNPSQAHSSMHPSTSTTLQLQRPSLSHSRTSLWIHYFTSLVSERIPFPDCIQSSSTQAQHSIHKALISRATTSSSNTIWTPRPKYHASTSRKRHRVSMGGIKTLSLIPRGTSTWLVRTRPVS